MRKTEQLSAAVSCVLAHPGFAHTSESVPACSEADGEIAATCQTQARTLRHPRTFGISLEALL